MSRRVNQADYLEAKFYSNYQRLDLALEAKKARKNCRLKLRALNGGLNGSKEDFEREVLPFWSKYGIKPKKMWYDLYCYSEGKYDPLYIPADLYWEKVYPALNMVSFRRAYTNKCIYDQLFPYLKKPGTILRNVNGIFTDGVGTIVSFEDAVGILEKRDSYVIKPAFYSGGGRDIYFHVAGEGDIDVIDTAALLNSYKSDYIVQELVEQHDVLASIHPQSVNTVRIISYLFGGRVHISSSILRMGTSGARMDNYSIGGVACRIGLDGRLATHAFDRSWQWVSSHPSGAVFEEIQVPSYDRILECVQSVHPELPFFRIIGWDFAVDKSGEPVFIEYNGAPDLNQVSCGPMFGNLTESILDFVFLEKPEPSLQALDEHGFAEVV
jgi:hypothetical protein